MTKKITLILLLPVLVFSCKTEPKEITKADLNGFWEQEGVGEIIEINDSTVVSYYSCLVSCYPNWKISRKYFNEETPTIVLNSDNSFTNTVGFTKHKYVQLKEIPTLCKELNDEQKKSNKFNFETLWHTYNEQYAFFKERQINWNLLKSKYQSKFTEQTAPFEFHLVLEELIAELDDEHSDVYRPEELKEKYAQRELKTPKDTTNYKKIVKERILKKYLIEQKKYNNGIISYGKINHNLGYIQLNEMDRLANYKLGINFNWEAYWEQAEESTDELQDNINATHDILNTIIEEFSSTKACIIDLRFNGGGYDKVSLAFLSHFIQEKQEVFKKKRRYGNTFSETQTISIEPKTLNYNKDVYILTSHFSVSATEILVLSSLNFSNFKRVGSKTNGALSDLLYKELPNGWNYSMSNEVYESIDGHIYEAKGIPADYKIEYSEDHEMIFKIMLEELKSEDKAIEKVIKLTKKL